MFVVYSPEGQSFIGAAQNLPVLKVDPAKSINKVEDSGLDQLNVDLENETKGNRSNALNAYKKNQTKTARSVIVKVSEIMTSPVISIDVNRSLEEAWSLMQTHAIKHLPVLDNGGLIGMCSQADVLGRVIVSNKGELEGVKPESVRAVMSAEAVTTSLDTDIRHVAQALSEYQIGALVVMSDYHEIIGIVTVSDLIHRLAKEPPIELYI